MKEAVRSDSEEMDIFLARFPEETRTIEINKERIKGFLRYTYDNFENVSSINPKAAKFIEKLNNLGFLKLNSQEGVRETKDAGLDLYGKPLSINGSRIVLSTYLERSYCDAFIRTDVLNLFEEYFRMENPKFILVKHPYDGSEIVLTKTTFKSEDGFDYDEEKTHVYATTKKDVKWQISQLSSETGYYSGPSLVPCL